MKMLVAIDDSDGSLHALRWSLDNLFPAGFETQHKHPDQDTNSVTLVNVQPIFQPVFHPAGPVMYAPPVVIDAVKEAQQKNAAFILKRALHTCKEKKVNVETLVLHGDPKDKICQAAEDLRVDLVVVGCRGLGMIERVFMGSVSDYCIHHLRCPVLIVKPPPKSAHDD